MNWRFTRPGHEVRFELGDPFCHFFPLPRGYLEAVGPELWRLEEESELMREVGAWAESRRAYERRADRRSPDPRGRWQARYYRGLDIHGEPAVADHATKSRLRPFAARCDASADGPEASDG